MPSLNHLVRSLALYLVPMILSLSVHEFAHAWVATRLGDDTPESEERLTLSPLAHIDPWGTLVIPILSVVTAGYAFIGWARPVRVNPARFRRGMSMRLGMALTSVAGPLSNVLLAIVSMGVFAFLAKNGSFARMSGGDALSTLLFAMFQINVGLAIFNLLPIPPFDGSRLLPRAADEMLDRMGQASFAIVLLILWVQPLRHAILDTPIQLLSHAIRSLFGV